MPYIFNLLMDPMEKMDPESHEWGYIGRKFVAQKLWAPTAAGRFLAAHLQSLQEFPPRQGADTLSMKKAIDDAMRKLDNTWGRRTSPKVSVPAARNELSRLSGWAGLRQTMEVTMRGLSARGGLGLLLIAGSAMPAMAANCKSDGSLTYLGNTRDASRSVWLSAPALAPSRWNRRKAARQSTLGTARPPPAAYLGLAGGVERQRRHPQATGSQRQQALPDRHSEPEGRHHPSANHHQSGAAAHRQSFS